MSKFAEPMSRLIDELKKLPGVGTQERAAPGVLTSCAPATTTLRPLAAAVRDVKASLRLCSVCNNITDVDPCVYCSQRDPQSSAWCAWSRSPPTSPPVEKTQVTINGVYHVLHGSLSPLHGVGPDQLRIAISSAASSAAS
jgi:recombination protein RecR